MNNLLSQLQTFNPLQIDQQVTQNALLRGQLDQQRLAAMQAQQAYADDQTARNALMQSGGDNDKYLSNLANAGATKAYGERLKANKDLAVSQADIKHKEALAAQEQTKSVLNTSQAKAKDYEVELQKHAQHVNELGAVQTPTDAMAWMLKGKAAFPEMFNDQAIMQMTQKLMASPEAFQQWKQGAMMGGVKVEEQLKLAQARAIADQSNTTSIENNKRTNQTHITTTGMNNAIAMRRDNMVDARSKEANKIAQEKAVYQTDEQGNTIALPSKYNPGTPIISTPVVGADGKPIIKPQKLGEAAKKQLTGIDSLGSAIDEYVKEIDNWSLDKAVSPDSRAAMGTKYNNMMLQAKEAYNLGVLNGPDYQILQSVVADPTGIKGTITSNSALKNQAKELKRLMEGTRAAVANQGKAKPSNAPTVSNW